MNSQQVAQIIESGLAGSRALVKSDDNVHFEAVVIAAVFAGKRSVQRHQLVEFESRLEGDGARFFGRQHDVRATQIQHEDFVADSVHAQNGTPGEFVCHVAGFTIWPCQG